jgi:DNA-binding response OmpR family regulator
MSATTVLVVEDDEDVRESTKLVLERHGFVVHTARDGVEGEAAAAAHHPHVALVDVALPGVDGIALTRWMRAELDVPVVLLTARSLPSDVVHGLEAGAEDYVTKPFDGAVLAARLRAVVRRVHGDPELRLWGGEVIVDRDAMTVRNCGELVPLTTTEFRLLQLLAENRPAVLSRAQILARVWGDPEWGDGRVVDVNVQRMRTKLPPELIATVRGFGYAIVDP